MKYLCIFLLCTFISLLQAQEKIEELTRKLDVFYKNYVEIISEIKFNPSKKSDKVYFYHIVPVEFRQKIVDVKALKLLDYQELTVSEVQQIPNRDLSLQDFVVYEIEIPNEENQKVISIEITEIYKRRLQPFPSKINIKEDQYLIYEDSKFFLSIYEILKQKSIFNIISRDVIFNTDCKQMEVKGSSIVYGPYKNTQGLQYEPIRIHFKKNEPLPIFQQAERVVEISNWGAIKIDEYFEVFNQGAGISGEFGRVDYNQYNPSDGKNAIKSFRTFLPRYIRGLYYYDFIGNISTSSAYRDNEKVDFEIEPRFPVFGQWKVDWNQGYTMPTRYHLFKSGDTYMFNYTFLHDYKDIVTDNYTVKIIFPEGTKDIQVHLPFEMDEKSFETHYSTLDYFGRPVLVIKKSNALTSLHDAYIQVTYHFKDTYLFIEHLYIILFVFAIFLSAIYFARFSLQFDEKKAKQI